MHATCSTKGLCVRGSATMATAHTPDTDKLSDLPEGVLHRIMSFLTLRQAVQTCILSQRWRHLWRSMPRINADSKEFELSDDEDSEEFDGRGIKFFRRFVNRMLELRDPVATMDSFSLRYSISDGFIGDTASVDANRWISLSLQKQTGVLDVYFDLLYNDFLPLDLDHSVFTSRYLTKICFSYVILADGFFKQFETGCPALEDLSLYDCVINDEEISSQTLKVLTINYTYSEFIREDKTSISTPSVTSLTLWSPIDGLTVLKDMASVVTASVKLFDQAESDDDDDDDDLVRDVRDLRQYLWTLSGVENLEFYYLRRKLTIDNNLQWCPKFNNLVNLTLCQCCLDANFSALIVLMQNSPRLENLTLKLCQPTSKGIICELNERSFTCEHLKFVEVISSKYGPQASSVEDFFLNNGVTAAQLHKKQVSSCLLPH